MYSLETIRWLNRKAAQEAHRTGTQPVPIDPEDIAGFPPFQIPFVGSARFKDWTKAGVTWFVDTTGLGAEDEPALTAEQFKTALLAHVLDHPDHGYAIVECGEFQAYVASFRPVRHRQQRLTESAGPVSARRRS